MALRQQDLKNTMLKKISVDEFEPKTGETKDVMVVGFHIHEQQAGKDLYRFLNHSIHEIRDVEVSPNPNPENYFMVFVEMDRNENSLDNIKSLVKEIENISGDLDWNISTLLSEKLIDLQSEELNKFVQLDPESYLSPDDWKAQKAEEAKQQETERLEAEAQDNSNKILEFLKGSSLLEAGINDNKLHMRGSKDIATLEIVDFGPAKDIMSDLGISESAVKEMNYSLRKFNSMLGEMKAIPIAEYIVVFGNNDDILVTKMV
tara:strand:+ start:20482 stop:21264 length:783 start_codon:yes stop_codon:yes gene_type:complete